MNSLLEQLNDIDGLDAISSWPLAIGWLVLIAVVILATSALIWVVINRILFKRSWKNDTRQKLKALEKNLSEQTARETVITLSEYLRRIALRRFSRKECASLMGKDWLEWLTQHDPKSFDWKNKGTLLIEIPYAPVHQELSTSQVKDLIQAVKSWVF